MSRPERTPVPASRYPIPYWDSLTPHFIEPRSMIVSSVLTGVASAIPAALPSSLAASTSSWVMSDPAQPARAAVIINSIIVVASKVRIVPLRGMFGIYLRHDVDNAPDWRSLAIFRCTSNAGAGWRKIGGFRLEDGATEVAPPPGFPSFVGGDPSAGSPTDTLLRLNPPCRRQARIPHREAASPTHN